MHHIMSFLILCFLLTAGVNAHPGPEGKHGDRQPPGAGDRVQHLSEKLDLDANQQEKLLSIFEAAEAERAAMREQHEKQIRREACDFKDALTEQIKSILTTEQAIEFDELSAHHAARREGHHRRHGKERRFNWDCAETNT